MNLILKASLASFFLLGIVALCSGQVTEEDVIILRDGKIFRGTISDLISVSTIIITRVDSRAAVLYMPEIAVMKRLPPGIPDSTLLKTLSDARRVPRAGQPWAQGTLQGEPPIVDLVGHQSLEDIVFAADGSMLRGVILNAGSDGTISLWTDGNLKEIPGSAIRKVVHVDRGIPHSILDETYINVPPLWSEGDPHILSLYTGIAGPGGGYGLSAVTRGFVVDLEGGILVGHNMRWVTTVSYSSHSRSMPEDPFDPESPVVDAPRGTIISGLTGVEFRTWSLTHLKVRCLAQVGISTLKASGTETAVPQSFYHLAGTVRVSDISASSFALSVAAGIIVNRFILDLRYTLTRPHYTAKTEALYVYDYTTTVEKSSDEWARMFTVTLGVSIF